MEEYHRKLLDQNLVSISNDLDLQEIIPFMIQHDILRRPQTDRLKGKTPYEANQDFITMLQKSGGERAFGAFMTCLYQTTQIGLLDKILPNWRELEIVAMAAGDQVGQSAISNNNNNALTLPITEGGDTGSEDEWESKVPAYPHVAQLGDNAMAMYANAVKPELEAYGQMEETKGVMENLQVVEMTDSAASTTFDPEEVYDNFSAPKGPALIINNRNFTERSGHLDRAGTDVDRENIKRLLINLGYHVKTKENLTAQQMYQQVQSLVLKHPSRIRACSSIVLVVLSHGKHGEIIGVDGSHLSIDHLMEPLIRCEDLYEKPKIAIIQACRGERFDQGVSTVDGGAFKRTLGAQSFPNIKAMLNKLIAMDQADAAGLRENADKIPSNADTLLLYSTTPGFVSWRNSLRGSWFIQAICEIFAEHACKEHIGDLCTRVNRQVAKAMSSQGCKQVPEPCSRLTKKFYFFPGVKRSG